MGNSNEINFSANFAVYQIEGEALQEIATRTPNIVWIHFGVLGNSFDGAIKFGKKGICRSRFSNSLGMNIVCRGDITALRFLLALPPRESD